MKKILAGVAAIAMVAAFSACNKCGDNSCGKTAVDSISTAYGNYVGSMVGADFARFDNNTKSDREDFVMGIQSVMASKDSKTARMGMRVALQMLEEMDQMAEQGVTIDRTAVVTAFKKAFANDSVDYTKLSALSDNFRMLYQRAVAEAEAKKAAEAMAEIEPETAAVAATGDEEFVAEFIAQNPGATTSESGLTYYIAEQGEGATPGENATVTVNYTGKHLDGSVFDSSEGRGPATFNLQDVIGGFREGLMLLGKGGKATLIMPANLAYGANGTPDGSIKPNETLMFEVELIDFN